LTGREPSAIELPAHWSGHQALAVFELIGMMRDQLWAHYRDAIQQAMREDRVEHTKHRLPLDPENPL